MKPEKMKQIIYDSLDISCPECGMTMTDDDTEWNDEYEEGITLTCENCDMYIDICMDGTVLDFYSQAELDLEDD